MTPFWIVATDTGLSDEPAVSSQGEPRPAWPSGAKSRPSQNPIHTEDYLSSKDGQGQAEAQEERET